MYKKGARNGVILDLKTKEGLEQLKTMSRTDTANVKNGITGS